MAAGENRCTARPSRAISTRAASIVATTTPYATSYARLAPGLLNSTEEVDATLAAVRALA